MICPNLKLIKQILKTLAVVYLGEAFVIFSELEYLSKISFSVIPRILKILL